ncbi:S-adenosyl-L-methionine-dependent methyltransferase [Pseudovirgaria hyperparasitica]|uniref:S-adenosyl-L-methionine-dependent methyltransferase n=1 Tax=Pseudovirgaria hyperparasitica TaxID=470096 RepID=A0A6A6WDC4_9PEZI|nr:S-adenosyl-L-methionine-dependent methyltransferase [Pseudovirgaria hyperparasitica]KAF2760828.1 S-adenosyl-L-methionine-dependent methyltransferase [Pseudovirgaria hyperparasitica]
MLVGRMFRWQLRHFCAPGTLRTPSQLPNLCRYTTQQPDAIQTKRRPGRPPKNAPSTEHVKAKKTRRPRVITASKNDLKPELTGLVDIYRSLSTPRVNVVSPELCDLSLDLVKHNLVDYVGCDIIDIQPGAGLWSARVHELLRPRTHILMEPDMDAFGPYLRPLLERPDSAFRHVAHPIGLLGSYEKAMQEISNTVSEGSLDQAPHQRRLLVTGSLMSWKTVYPLFPMAGKTSTTMGRQLLKQFISSISNRSLFHNSGPARMLLWVNEYDMWPYLPRSLQNPNRAAMGTQLMTDITQIAGTNEHRGEGKFGQRNAAIESISSKLVASRMARTGMTFPLDRQNLSYKAGQQAQLSEDALVPQATDTKLRHHNRIPEMKLWLENIEKETVLPGFSKKAQARLLEAQEQLASGAIEVPTDAEFRKKNARSKYPFWDRIGKDIIRFKSNLKKSGKREDGLAMLEEVLRLERATFSATSEEERIHLRKQWEVAKDRLDSMRARLPTKDQLAFSTDHDEYVGLTGDRPNLMWDRRPFEPLLILEDEIFPAQGAALVDIVPKEIRCTADEYRRFEDFMIPLRSLENGKVRVALDTAGHGASELVDQVELLRNPYEGGRLDPDDMYVKNLTPEMILQLSRAWMAWPFRDPTSDRPSHFELSHEEG